MPDASSDKGILPDEVAETLHGPKASPAVAQDPTRDKVRKLLFDEARKLSGHLSSRDVPDTEHGNLACAWAVNEVARRALGRRSAGA